MKSFIVVVSLLFCCLMTEVSEARRGCCSYHEGVSVFEKVGKDGTALSEICVPYYNQEEKKMPVPTILIMRMKKS